MIGRLYKVGDRVYLGQMPCVITDYVDHLNVCKIRFDNGRSGIVCDEELTGEKATSYK